MVQSNVDWDEENCIITAWGHDKNWYRGLILDPRDEDLIHNLRKINGITVTVNKDFEKFHHAPESDYLYKYKDPRLQCQACKAMIRVSKIENDWIDDDLEVKVCPLCKGYDSFEDFQYETIEEALSVIKHKSK